MNEETLRTSFEEWAETHWLSIDCDTHKEAAWAGYQEGFRQAEARYAVRLQAALEEQANRRHL